MTKQPIRDPAAGPLITPPNAAFVFNDYERVSLARDPQRDWARIQTLPEIVLIDRLVRG